MEGSGSATIRSCNLSHASKENKNTVTEFSYVQFDQISCSFIKTDEGLIVAESVNE